MIQTDKLYRNDKSGLHIMAHVVAGYPDMRTSERLVHAMVESGADLIEIQIPFSDPLADGPTIMKANHQAIRRGITTESCFDLVRRLRHSLSIPILFMTYGNIVFSYGVENFIKRCSDEHVDGVIAPDIPVDEEDDEYFSLCNKYRIHPISVISPITTVHRIRQILDYTRGFVYTTLKVGITGARPSFEHSILDFLDTLHTLTRLPIAAGFGISCSEHLSLLKDHAEIAVIGSHLINLLDNQGISGVQSFLRDCRRFTT